jgi:hypothetical protein
MPHDLYEIEDATETLKLNENDEEIASEFTQ